MHDVGPLLGVSILAAVFAAGGAVQWYRLRQENRRRNILLGELARLDSELATREGELADCRAALDNTLTEKEKLQSGLEAFQAAFDALPLPIWLRRPDLTLGWANTAHRMLTGDKAPVTTDEAADDRARSSLRELAAGGGLRMLAELARSDGAAHQQRLLLTANGERRFFRITEAPLSGLPPDSSFIGIGHGEDLTPLESLRGDLDRHMSANAEVLERVGSAIALFGADSRLAFFNRAFVDLWGLADDWLRTRPSIGEWLEELHSRRSLPEYADFPSFKRERLERYRRLMEPIEELMHLPDGKTIRVLSAPHPLGGVVLVMDDVTDRLALLSSFNTLVAVQQEVLGQLAEGIAVFGGDGRLKLSNPAFAHMWEIDAADLTGEPHITAVFERLRPLLDHGDERGDDYWDGLKEDIVGATLDRAIRSGRLERTDGRVIEFSIEPLPDGAVLNVHLDVTDSVRLDDNLLAADAALAAAEQLRSTFMSTVSLFLRTPLSDIVGFTEVLQNAYFGPLTAQQRDYVDEIRGSAERALHMLDDMLDVTARDGSGDGALELAQVDTQHMLNTLLSLTREWARRDGIDMLSAIPPDLGRIRADEKRLFQALFSLIIAAIHNAPVSRALCLSARRDAGTLTITIGPGTMPDNNSNPLGGNTPLEGNDPLDATIPLVISELRGSLSLSSTLARNMLGRHGGRLEVDEIIGEGPRLRCILPIDGPQNPE